MLPRRLFGRSLFPRRDHRGRYTLQLPQRPKPNASSRRLRPARPRRQRSSPSGLAAPGTTRGRCRRSKGVPGHVQVEGRKPGQCQHDVERGDLKAAGRDAREGRHPRSSPAEKVVRGAMVPSRRRVAQFRGRYGRPRHAGRCNMLRSNYRVRVADGKIWQTQARWTGATGRARLFRSMARARTALLVLR